MVNKTCFASVDVEDRGIRETNEILSIFEKYGILATLFVTGEALLKNAELMKEWGQVYEIASHGFTHRFWNTLNLEERQKELDDFINLYRETFQKAPQGFRAPSHVIDKQGIALLNEKGFLYDSSVVPHYPPFKKYRGYLGKAPLSPYRLLGVNILEIPVRGQLLGIPLAGAWISGLPIWFYRILFAFHRPNFITLNMHSWDVLKPGFVKKIEEIVKILIKKNYQFLNGEQILKNQ